MDVSFKVKVEMDGKRQSSAKSFRCSAHPDLLSPQGGLLGMRIFLIPELFRGRLESIR